VVVANPGSASSGGRPIEVTLTPTCRDPRWSFRPDHQHSTIPASETRKLTFSVSRPGTRQGLDAWFGLPTLRLQADYLAAGVRISMREKTEAVAVRPPTFSFDPEQPNGSLSLGGKAFLEVPRQRLKFAADALTVEAFVRGAELHGRRCIVQGPGFALRLVDGKPAFEVNTGSGRSVVGGDQPILPGRWHHVAGVFGGGELSLYLDGGRVAARDLDGDLRLRGKRVLVGAALDGRGRLAEFAQASIDELRISSTARYRGKLTELGPRTARHRADAFTTLLLHLDRDRGPWVAEFSAASATALRVGAATCVADR
jgi:hypothetical protein